MTLLKRISILIGFSSPGLYHQSLQSPFGCTKMEAAEQGQAVLGGPVQEQHESIFPPHQPQHYQEQMKDEKPKDEEEQTKPVSGSPIKNENGRRFFFVLCAVFLILSLILAVSIARGASFWLSLPAAAGLLGMVDLVVCIYFCDVFVERMANAGFFVILALSDLMGLLGSPGEIRQRWLWFGVLHIGVALLHALVPMDSPAARLLLPWILHNSDAIITSDSPTLTANNEDKDSESGKHTHQIRHRTLSVFHDWPAPIPFTATTLYSFKTSSSSELPFQKGEELTILDCRGNWWQARHPLSGQIGFVPSNFIAVKQKAKVLLDSKATAGSDELDVKEGEVVEVMEMHEAAYLCRGANNKIGSIPSEYLELIH